MTLQELYKLHKDKHWDNSATYSSIHYRKKRWWTDEDAINTPNMGIWWDRRWWNITKEYNEYLSKWYRYVKYSTYRHYRTIFTDEEINGMRKRSNEWASKLYREVYLKGVSNPVWLTHFYINYKLYGKEKALKIEKIKS